MGPIFAPEADVWNLRQVGPARSLGLSTILSTGGMVTSLCVFFNVQVLLDNYQELYIENHRDIEYHKVMSCDPY